MTTPMSSSTITVTEVLASTDASSSCAEDAEVRLVMAQPLMSTHTVPAADGGGLVAAGQPQQLTSGTVDNHQKRKNTSFKITNVLPSRPPSNDLEDSGEEDTEDTSDNVDHQQQLLNGRMSAGNPQQIDRRPSLDRRMSQEYLALIGLPYQPPNAPMASYFLTSQLQGYLTSVCIAPMDTTQGPKDRFKVVKIDSSEPIKRGRWTNVDFADGQNPSLSSASDGPNAPNTNPVASSAGNSPPQSNTDEDKITEAVEQEQQPPVPSSQQQQQQQQQQYPSMPQSQNSSYHAPPFNPNASLHQSLGGTPGLANQPHQAPHHHHFSQAGQIPTSSFLQQPTLQQQHVPATSLAAPNIPSSNFIAQQSQYPPVASIAGSAAASQTFPTSASAPSPSPLSAIAAVSENNLHQQPPNDQQQQQQPQQPLSDQQIIQQLQQAVSQVSSLPYLPPLSHPNLMTGQQQTFFLSSMQPPLQQQQQAQHLRFQNNLPDTNNSSMSNNEYNGNAIDQNHLVERLEEITSNGDGQGFAEGSESAPGSTQGAIDNRIEQAMDLVKSHLMNAVRSEVEDLKEKIIKLEEIINNLQFENDILKTHASNEVLSLLQQQQQQQQLHQQQLLLQQQQQQLPAAGAPLSINAQQQPQVQQQPQQGVNNSQQQSVNSSPAPGNGNNGNAGGGGTPGVN